MRNGPAWALGIAALMFLPVLILAAGPDEAQDWLSVYWAGAGGGLVLELIGGGWGLELPSYKKGRRPPGKQFAPFGPWLDLGFLGRMTMGAIAAPVFLVLIQVVVEETSSAELSALGDNLDNLAWGVLIGAASPSAWKLGEAIALARINLVRARQAENAVGQAQEDVQALQKQAADEGTPAVSAEDVARVAGKLEVAQSLLAGGAVTPSGGE